VTFGQPAFPQTIFGLPHAAGKNLRDAGFFFSAENARFHTRSSQHFSPLSEIAPEKVPPPVLLCYNNECKIQK
jgi:hypothetical protein